MGRSEKSSKHRRRSRSSSSDRDRSRKSRKNRSPSSSSDDGGSKFQNQLDKEREEKKRVKKLEKQRRKDEETPEEKRARRLAKKMAKEQRRKSDNDNYLPPELSYTNEDNPFNDNKLTETFVWGKKLQKEGKGRLSQNELEREARNRVQKNMREIEDQKRARHARQSAKEDLDMMQRDMDRRANADWDEKEAQFQLGQAKVRSKLRIQQNRAKPIDLLSRFIQFADENNPDDDFELESPLLYIRDLTLDDYEDLIEDIKVYRSLEGDSHASYWKQVRVVVEDKLKKLQNNIQRGGIHGTVNDQVQGLIKGKSLEELVRLEMDIEARFKANTPGMDVSFWEDVLEQLRVHMAKSKLKEIHQKMLSLKVQRIREEQMKGMAGEEKPLMRSTKDKPSTSRVKQETTEEEDTENLQKSLRKKVDLDELDSADLNDQQKETKWRALSPDRLESATLALYERGRYSPTYGDVNDTMPGIEVLEEEDDEESLLKRRAQNRKVPEGSSSVQAEMMAIARKGMDGSEATFSVETPLEAQKYLWSDKYRPRKPTYLNRVMTGFDWNKYNQTHYDMDNPPPKIVQGYKFNIFYPDLLDNKKTPSYQVFECDDPDFAEVRFRAGPPYEDIAFKIVNREWEVSYKNGFKCQFQNGVFQLWFQFKKYRYRR